MDIIALKCFAVWDEMRGKPGGATRHKKVLLLFGLGAGAMIVFGTGFVVASAEPLKTLLFYLMLILVFEEILNELDRSTARNDLRNLDERYANERDMYARYRMFLQAEGLDGEGQLEAVRCECARFVRAHTWFTPRDPGTSQPVVALLKSLLGVAAAFASLWVALLGAGLELEQLREAVRVLVLVLCFCFLLYARIKTDRSVPDVYAVRQYLAFLGRLDAYGSSSAPPVSRVVGSPDAECEGCSRGRARRADPRPRSEREPAGTYNDGAAGPVS